MKAPGISIPFVSQERMACVLSELVGIPITIYAGARIVTTIRGPYLYARSTTSPYYARPFSMDTVIANPTNTTNATVDIPDADAIKFAVGDSCTYYDVSAAGLYTGAAKVISAIGVAGSGGTGETLITFTGVWTTAPVATDLLVVSDGTQLSKNACVVMEDIKFDGSSYFNTVGYIRGEFVAGLVNGTTYFVQADNQVLQFRTIVL
jgi:hypothetical protein